jgi:hypothetical protein
MPQRLIGGAAVNHVGERSAAMLSIRRRFKPPRAAFTISAFSFAARIHKLSLYENQNSTGRITIDFTLSSRIHAAAGPGAAGAPQSTLRVRVRPKWQSALLSSLGII